MQEAWPIEPALGPGRQIVLSILNINKANFMGSFKVIVSHQVRAWYRHCHMSCVLNLPTTLDDSFLGLPEAVRLGMMHLQPWVFTVSTSLPGDCDSP